MIALNAVAGQAACASDPDHRGRAMPGALACAMIAILKAGTATTDHPSAADMFRPDHEPAVGAYVKHDRSSR